MFKIQEIGRIQAKLRTKGKAVRLLALSLRPPRCSRPHWGPPWGPLSHTETPPEALRLLWGPKRTPVRALCALEAKPGIALAPSSSLRTAGGA